MTHAHLAACPACSRHVRVTETACPFCGGALADSFRAQTAPVPLTVRLSRAALLALGTGTLSLAAACGGATSSVPSDGGGGADAKTSEVPDGASSVFDSGNGGYDSSNVAVPYGLPPPPPEDAGTEPPPADASAPDAHFVAPPYGLPP